MPVITTGASGAGALVTNGDNGFIVPEADAEALAAAMASALRTPERATEDGAALAGTGRAWTVADSNAEHARVVEFLTARRSIRTCAALWEGSVEVSTRIVLLSGCAGAVPTAKIPGARRMEQSACCIAGCRSSTKRAAPISRSVIQRTVSSWRSMVRSTIIATCGGEYADFPFRTESDTEVIVAAYVKEGIAGFKRLNGMFAFVLVDERRGRVILARDAVGKKPLFTFSAPGALLFGSSLLPLIACSGTEPRSMPEAAAFFWRRGYISPDT